ncbi:hypothetical protein NPIL_357081, partial [Nephila pilipes]
LTADRYLSLNPFKQGYSYSNEHSTRKQLLQALSNTIILNMNSFLSFYIRPMPPPFKVNENSDEQNSLTDNYQFFVRSAYLRIHFSLPHSNVMNQGLLQHSQERDTTPSSTSPANFNDQ